MACKVRQIRRKGKDIGIAPVPRTAPDVEARIALIQALMPVALDSVYEELLGQSGCGVRPCPPRVTRRPVSGIPRPSVSAILHGRGRQRRWIRQTAPDTIRYTGSLRPALFVRLR
jgi:hypothetical protein